MLDRSDEKSFDNIFGSTFLTDGRKRYLSVLAGTLTYPILPSASVLNKMVEYLMFGCQSALQFETPNFNDFSRPHVTAGF